MAYAILRTAKLKSFGEIGGSLSHTYRTRHTPNADPTRTPLNAHSSHTADLVMSDIKQHLPDKVRSNAVLCVEYLITASPEWSGWKDKAQEADFFKRSVKWLEARHGKEHVIATSVHYDETTPHLIAYVVPIDLQGKLNARSFLGGRATLSKMQTDFHSKVKDLGLERGLEGSKAEHKTVKEFYAELQEPLPKAEKININIQRLDVDNQPKSPFYDTKYEHGIRVMDAVYENVELQVNEIKNNFEIKLAEMQENFEKNLRIERQNAEAQRKAHEKAVDALNKNMKNLEDLKETYKQFIEFKRIFPKEFNDIEFQIKNKIANFENEKRNRYEAQQRQRIYEQRLEEQRQAEREKQKQLEFKKAVENNKELYKNLENKRFDELILKSDEAKSRVYRDLKTEFQQLKSQDPYELLRSIQQQEKNYYLSLVAPVFRSSNRNDFEQSVDDCIKFFSIMKNQKYLDQYDDPLTTSKICIGLDSILDERAIHYNYQIFSKINTLKPLLYEAMHCMQDERMPSLISDKQLEIYNEKREQRKYAENERNISQDSVEFEPELKSNRDNDFSM